MQKTFSYNVFPKGAAMEDEQYKLVYSDRPPAPQQKAPGSGRAFLRLERKGRSGKTVTVAGGLALADDQLRVLLKEIQKACGTGGTVKEHCLELQGDCREKIRPLLNRRGYKIA
jgi:translation initiation factor 1